MADNDTVHQLFFGTGLSSLPAGKNKRPILFFPIMHLLPNPFSPQESITVLRNEAERLRHVVMSVDLIDHSCTLPLILFPRSLLM
jgi:hypothetical protein